MKIFVALLTFASFFGSLLGIALMLIVERRSQPWLALGIAIAVFILGILGLAVAMLESGR